MARAVLDQQLHEITTRTIRLGTLVDKALEQALQGVQSGDQALCGVVIAADVEIDKLRAEVEQQAFKSLTLQQPLAGHDLRFLCSVPSIVADLERVGDNAAGIAKLLECMVPLQARGMSQAQMPPSVASPSRPQKETSADPVTEAAIVTAILTLGSEARHLLQETMRAFAQSDTQAARSIWQEDDVVDVRYHMVRHDLMTMLTAMHAIPALQQDSLVLQRMTYWLWIAHNLERVGDHCTNVCERIVFFLEGDGIIKPDGESPFV